MARKLKEIEVKIEELVLDLAEIGANDTEIANILSISQKTLKNRYSEFLIKGRANLRNKLRRKMIEVAMKGNVAMLIFLAKNYLKMNEQGEEDKRIKIIIQDLIKANGNNNQLPQESEKNI